MGILNAILPIAFLLILGAFLKNVWLKEPVFWSSVEKLVFYILFPAMMVEDISTANIGNIHATRFVPLLIMIVLSVMFVVWLLRFIFRDKDFFVSFIQGCVRYNSYVFIGVSLFYLGHNTMPIIAVITPFMIITTNIVSVILLNVYAGQKTTIASVLLKTVKNPLVVSCFVGLVMNALHITLPTFLNNFLEELGNASIALSLLAVGAALHFEKDVRRLTGISLCAVVKLVILPSLVLLTLLYFHLPHLVIATCVIYAGSPCSTNAYIMSKNMNGDYKSMGLIISTQTLLSLVTLSCLLGVLSFI